MRRSVPACLLAVLGGCGRPVEAPPAWELLGRPYGEFLLLPGGPPLRPLVVPGAGAAPFLLLGEVDGDGVPDLRAGPGGWLCRGLGGLVFAAPAPAPWEELLPGLDLASRPARGDLDGDGWPDLVGFPAGGLEPHLWRGGPGPGELQPPRPLRYPAVGPPTILRGEGAGFALAEEAERTDLFLQAWVRRPLPGPWHLALVARRSPAGAEVRAEVELLREGPEPAWRFRLAEIEGAGDRTLAWRVAGHPDGEWHDFSAVLQGPRAILWWDGTLLLEAETSRLAAGAAGIAARAGTIHCGPFLVGPPPGSQDPGPGTSARLLKPASGCWREALDLPDPDGRRLLGPAGTAGGPVHWEAADWDGDGDGDLLLSQPDFPLAWLENLGGVVFRTPQALRLSSGRPVWAGPGATPAVGDLDGDGRLDLLVGLPGGTVRLFRGKSLARPVTPRGPEWERPGPALAPAVAAVPPPHRSGPGGGSPRSSPSPPRPSRAW